MYEGIYNGNYSNLYVYKIPAGSSTPIDWVTGFSDIAGVAADGLGNVFVADQGKNTIYKIPAGTYAAATFAAGISNLTGLAADASEQRILFGIQTPHRYGDTRERRD